MIDCMNANEKLLWKKNPFPWMKIGEMRESKIVIRKDADGDEKSVSWMKTLQWEKRSWLIPQKLND